jgi:hypothetical protein
MDKTIKIEMLNDKSLSISINDENKLTLPPNSRSITADAIYNLIAFTDGDKYNVVSENTPGVDSQVLDFFTELFVEITNKVNAICSDE